jgi:putative tricarboxylic transport membrane protein
MIVTVILFAIAAVMSVQIVLGHRRTRTQRRDGGLRTDWKATATVVVAFLVFGALLLPLGWIVAGALLFWGVARGLGSRRPGFDLLLAVGMSCLVQLAFSAGLGLRLPPGIFGWF